MDMISEEYLRKNRQLVISVKERSQQQDLINNIVDELDGEEILFSVENEKIQNSKDFYKNLYHTLFNNTEFGHNLDALEDILGDVRYADPRRINDQSLVNHDEENEYTYLVITDFDKVIACFPDNWSDVLDIVVGCCCLDYGTKVKYINISVVVTGLNLTAYGEQINDLGLELNEYSEPEL